MVDEHRAWRTSTRSQGDGQCVEVGPGRHDVAVRDTKDREGGTLTVSPAAWSAFVADVQHA